MAIDLGLVTAYAYAVAGGYEGTEAEFEQLLGDIANDLSEIENLSVVANTLPAGSSATASYSDGVLTLGIPRGDTGATGAGATVAAGTTTTGAEGTNASVTNSGTSKDAVFNFTIPRGNTGNGIDSIYLTGTSGAVKTYTILFTDGNTTTFEVTDGEVTEAQLETILDEYARIDGYYEDLTSGYAENLISNVYDEENVPYNFRTAGGSLDIGAFEYDEIVGGSLAVNQLVSPRSNDTSAGVTYTYNNDGSGIINGTATNAGNLTLNSAFPYIANHKLFVSSGATLPTGAKMTISGLSLANGATSQGILTYASTNNLYARIDFANGTVFNNLKVIPQIIDLTQMFGSTIADYIYTLEQGSAGAGVAWFKRLFPKPYYPYNAGELMHVQTSGHKMVGFNQWDEEWESGGINTSGQETSTSGFYRSKNYTPILPNTTYYFKSPVRMSVMWYDENKSFIDWQVVDNATVTTPNNARYLRFRNTDSGAWTPYNNDICINLHWDGERDGEYEAYSAHTYPLDSDLVLRGVPKLDSANKLYYDGDTYEADGTVTRKYGIVDLGTLSWTYGRPLGGTTYYFFTTDLTGIAKFATVSGTPNAQCAKYLPTPANVMNNYYDANDKGLALYNNWVFIHDSAYSDATAFTSAVNGVYLVYELATPTTETADAFQSPQAVSNWGTEEYIDTRSIPIPVGHNTKYPPDLKAKLETSPNPPDADGDYIVRQTNGVNEYVALSTNATIQNIISRLEALEG